MSGVRVEGPATVVFGVHGLQRVRYTGNVNGRWTGKVTCREYGFSRGRREQYVDKRDVEALCGQRDAEDATLFEVVGATQ